MEDGLEVIKATHEGECGRMFGPKRFASEEAYLERIRVLNTEFALDWRVLGFHGTGSRRRIVTAQPAIPGESASHADIAHYFKGLGFQFHNTKFGDAWYRKRDNLLVSDAEPNNVLITPDGIVPIDIQACRPDEALLHEAGIT